MKIPYFPGCTLKTTAKNFEISALEVSKVLDIELVELPKWNCCGTVTSLTDDDLMHHLAPIRDLIRVEEMNESGLVDNEYRVVALCTMCFNVLKRSNQRIKERPDEFKKLNDFMYLEKDYQGKTEVIHYMELLRDLDFSKVSEKVKNPLKGLKVSPYYGCLMLRPKEVGIDDPESPTIQADLLGAIGADVIDNPFKIECCGSYHTIEEKQLVSRRAYRITSYAVERGADAIMLSCPLCHFNLDVRGKEAEKLFKDYKQIPIYYYTQLISVALGLDPSVYGFDQHMVDPTLLLKKKGVLHTRKIEI